MNLLLFRLKLMAAKNGIALTAIDFLNKRFQFSSSVGDPRQDISSHIKPTEVKMQQTVRHYSIPCEFPSLLFQWIYTVGSLHLLYHQ